MKRSATIVEREEAICVPKICLYWKEEKINMGERQSARHLERIKGNQR